MRPQTLSLLQSWQKLTPKSKAKAVKTLADAYPAEWAAAYPRFAWLQKARPAQLPPPGNWSVWFYMAGRGAGKTRAGSEWVTLLAETCPGIRIALVASSAGDARDVMIEGESGIMECTSPTCRPLYEPSKRRLTWPNGSIATTFSGENPEELRGPQFHFAWCDELGKWRYQDEAWSNLRLATRLGSHPQTFISTTPRTTPRLRAILADPNTVLTTGTTYDNRENLAESFYTQIITEYEGTRLGRQELMGELLLDHPGALWTWEMIEPHRITDPTRQLPTMNRIVVGVDPAVTDDPNTSDETGIIVAARGINGHFYVLDDQSLISSPLGWASAVAATYHRHRASLVVAEENNGGKLIEENIRRMDTRMNYRGVRAMVNKQARAEPIVLLYERGIVHHVGNFTDLEQQMTEWDPAEASQHRGRRKSPDRVDALVWALTELSGRRILPYTPGMTR
ncbi:MAG TPA: terminase family protein [Methanocorpusculum sp.]|nr:terminase family protein [Methanocorpusculum sp.]